MKFFRLTHPKYESDQEDRRRNPVRQRAEAFVPPMSCEICADDTGGRWASSDRITIDLSQHVGVRSLLGLSPLPRHEWAERAKALAEMIQIPVSEIRPGAFIGQPRGELRRLDTEEIVHPAPGVIWVKPRVRIALETAQLRAADFAPVALQWKGNRRVPTSALPEFWELVARGKAWRIGQDLETITACKACGRTVFPQPWRLTVDETRWDGSDFFHVDLNPNIVIITERAASILASGGFTNYVSIPV